MKIHTIIPLEFELKFWLKKELQSLTNYWPRYTWGEAPFPNEMFCFFFIKNMLIPHPDINSHLRDLRRNWNCGLKPVLSNYQLSQLHKWAIIGGCCLAWRWKFIKVPSSDGLWSCHRHTEVIDKSFDFEKKLLLFSLRELENWIFQLSFCSWISRFGNISCFILMLLIWDLGKLKLSQLNRKQAADTNQSITA